MRKLPGSLRGGGSMLIGGSGTSVCHDIFAQSFPEAVCLACVQNFTSHPHTGVSVHTSPGSAGGSPASRPERRAARAPRVVLSLKPEQVHAGHRLARFAKPWYHVLVLFPISYFLLPISYSSLMRSTFDTQPMLSATLADLDQRLFENRYLPSAFAPDVLEANERTLAQRLAATKMIP